MVTLWPIAEEAREKLEEGEHVFLKSDTSASGVVLAFEEHLGDRYDMLEWEIENGWRKLDEELVEEAEAVVSRNKNGWADMYQSGDEDAIKYGVGSLMGRLDDRNVYMVDARVALERAFENLPNI